MRESSSAATALADGIPGPPGPGVRATRSPPASTVADSPEVMLRLADDHDRIAGELNDLMASAVLGGTGPGSRTGADRRALCRGQNPARHQRAGPGDQGHQGCGVRFPPAGLACAREVRPRMTTTGQGEWCRQCWPAGPGGMSANPSCPRLPAIIRPVPAAASGSAVPGSRRRRAAGRSHRCLRSRWPGLPGREFPRGARRNRGRRSAR